MYVRMPTLCLSLYHPVWITMSFCSVLKLEKKQASGFVLLLFLDLCIFIWLSGLVCQLLPKRQMGFFDSDCMELVDQIWWWYQELLKKKKELKICRPSVIALSSHPQPSPLRVVRYLFEKRCLRSVVPNLTAPWNHLGNLEKPWMPGFTPESEMQFLHSLEYWSFKDFSRQFHCAARIENQRSKGATTQTCMTFRALQSWLMMGMEGNTRY